MKYNSDPLKIRFRYIRRSILPLAFLIILFMPGTTYPFFSWHPLVSAETLGELEQEADAGTRYVEFQNGTLWYTGYDYITDQQKTGSCYYTLLDDQCVFFIVSPDHTASTLDQKKVSGTLRRDLATTSRIVEGMAEDLSWTADELEQMSSALLIDETSDDRMFYNICFLFTGLLIALAGIILIRNIFFILFPGRTKRPAPPEPTDGLHQPQLIFFSPSLYSASGNSSAFSSLHPYRL